MMILLLQAPWSALLDERHENVKLFQAIEMMQMTGYVVVCGVRIFNDLHGIAVPYCSSADNFRLLCVFASVSSTFNVKLEADVACKY